MNLRAGHSSARIDERIQDQPQLAPWHDADFDDPIRLRPRPRRLEIQHSNRRLVDRQHYGALVAEIVKRLEAARRAQ